MKTTANEPVLAALKQVVGTSLKNWLDEHEADVLQALRAAIAERQPPPARMPEAKREPQFLNTAEVAARWQLHRETVRLMVRQGRLPRMTIGRRVLVPMSAIVECEKQGWVASRR
jgi:excisionase family DNA binding protein